MTGALSLVLISVAVGAVGQACIKAAMLQLGPIAFSTPAGAIDASLSILRQPFIWLAIPLYGSGFLAWAIALSRLQLSYAYPLLAVGYLINPLVAIVLFGEPIPTLRWIGIACIMLGVTLVGRS